MVIYKIEVEGQETFYIGSAHNFHKRRLHHLNRLRRGQHRNIYLQRLFDKHGEESLSFHILEEVVGDNEDLLKKEQEWIDKNDFSKLINICPTAGNTAGRKHTEKSKMLMSKNHADVSGENNPMFGKSGELSPNYGKKHSEETKRKISEGNKGKESWSKGKKRPKHSEKMKGENNPFHGKTHTDEVKKKLSEAKKKAARERGGKKLTFALAKEIRMRYNSEEKITITQLAKDYGISRTYCGKVIKGIFWSDND
jgi:group I intron endonuclease